MPSGKGPRLDDLPNEILGMIMELGDIAALDSLVSASSRARNIFISRPRKLLLNAICRSEKERQLQKFFCTIVSIRERHKHTSSSGFRAYVDARLKDRSTDVDLDLSCTPVTKIIDTLADAAEIYAAIEEAQNSYVRVQLLEMRSLVLGHIAGEGFTELESSGTIHLRERSLSTTEVFRIRRALWRLRLYFEAYYEPYIPFAVVEREATTLSPSDFRAHYEVPTDSLQLWGCPYEARRRYISTQAEFFYQMTVWELEELECVWYHLGYQNKYLWRRPCKFCGCHCLPDRLVAHIRGCRNLRLDSDSNPGCGPHFQQACNEFRCDLEIGCGNRRTTDRDSAMWPEGPARDANAGFRFLVQHHAAIRPDDPPQTIMRSTWDEFCYWGYAIWDRERFEDCSLIDSQDGVFLAKLGWWRSDSAWYENQRRIMLRWRGDTRFEWQF